jgi:hypothetical protein
MPSTSFKKPPKALKLREAKAAMALKEITMKALAARTRVNYTVVVQVLNGHFNNAAVLNKLLNAIAAWPTPEEAHL